MSRSICTRGISCLYLPLSPSLFISFVSSPPPPPPLTSPSTANTGYFTSETAVAYEHGCETAIIFQAETIPDLVRDASLIISPEQSRVPLETHDDGC